MTSVLYGWLNIDVVNTLARAPTDPACTYTRRTTDSNKGSQMSTSLSPSPAKRAASRSRFVTMEHSNASLRAPRWRLRSLANEISTSLIRDHINAMGLLPTQLNDALRQMHVYTDTAELLSSYSEEQIRLGCMIGCKTLCEHAWCVLPRQSCFVSAQHACPTSQHACSLRHRHK